MSPFNVRILVAVFIQCVAIELKLIIAYITGQVNIVLCVYFMTDSQIDIIE